MDIGILDVGWELAEAYGITNGSSQGLEPLDDPLAFDRNFPAGFTISIRPKNAEDLPSPLFKRRKRQEKCNWGLVEGMTLDWAIGQIHGDVRSAGCLCIRLEVGQWVLVLVGVLTA